MSPHEQRKRNRAQDLKALEHGRGRDLLGVTEEFRRGRMSRRQFLERGLTLGFSVTALGTLLAACGGGESEPSPSSTIDRTKPAEVTYYGWADCMDRETPKAFQRATGIRMRSDVFDDNEFLLAKLRAGGRGWDVITPSDYMVHVLIMSKLVQPLDMSLLPNFSNVMPKFVKPPYDDESDGEKYSTPWMWGTTGIGYRTDLVSDPVTSWSVLWDPANKDRFTMLNDERETLAVGLITVGASINSTDQVELDAATDKLIEQKPLVRQYDSLSCRRNLVQGMPLMHAWNGDVLMAYQEIGDKAAFVLPDKGYAMWSDGCMIPVGAPSPYGAHLLMDYFMVPENAARIVNFAGYNIPIKGIDALLDPAFVKFYPADDEIDRAQFYNDLGEFAKNYAAAWARVKSA